MINIKLNSPGLKAMQGTPRMNVVINSLPVLQRNKMNYPKMRVMIQMPVQGKKRSQPKASLAKSVQHRFSRKYLAQNEGKTKLITTNIICIVQIAKRCTWLRKRKEQINCYRKVADKIRLSCTICPISIWWLENETKSPYTIYLSHINSTRKVFSYLVLRNEGW